MFDQDKTIKTMEIIDTYYINHNSVHLQNFTLENFANKISCFVHIVEFWTQLLGLLLSKCDNHLKRKNIINNLYDENCDRMSRVETFYAFLIDCLNLDLNLENILSKARENPILIKYKQEISDFIINNSFDDVCEMLGSAEYVYYLISEDVCELYYKHKNSNPTFHFNTTEIKHTKHATDLFECSSNKESNLDNVIFGINWMVNLINELLI